MIYGKLWLVVKPTVGIPLFLGAVVLFAMTFVMNTIAELLRQRLRERNKIV